MAFFDATKDFSNAICEVDLLLKKSERSAAILDEQNALNKAAILLLTAKMEAFVEQLIEEFCFSISALSLTCEQIPAPIRIHATKYILNNDALLALERNKAEKIVECMEKLSLLWRKGCLPTELSVDCSFAYGKHGEREFKRLFQRIGIEDVFASCQIVEEVESIDDTDNNDLFSIAPDVNALTGIRNYILHNDGTPNVTYNQIKQYRDHLISFAQRIDIYLNQMKQSLTTLSPKASIAIT